jgi:hypothetical protein
MIDHVAAGIFRIAEKDILAPRAKEHLVALNLMVRVENRLPTDKARRDIDVGFFQ